MHKTLTINKLKNTMKEELGMIEILEFVKEEKENSPIIGHALIEISGKMKLWFRILRAPKGKPYCRPPSLFLGGEYKPVYYLSDQEKMRKLLMQVIEALVKKGFVEC